MNHHTDRKLKKSEVIQIYCMGNLKKFLQETTLHGFKYLADSSLSIWEKLFFLTTITACFVTVSNLISNIYARWDSTPVIIGISPHQTSIMKIPLPSVTLCNMNQALYSKVANYTMDSPEYNLLKFLCYSEAEFSSEFEHSQSFKNNNLRIDNFILQHAQPCERMFLYCSISSIAYNCSELFQEVMTDEGLCCVFNKLRPDFLYKERNNVIKDQQYDGETKAVNWNPEDGYIGEVPEKHYPRASFGTGISMGVTFMLNAELDEYYCSSTNGPGFKISIANPIETPHVKETGLMVPLGSETRFRLEVVRSEASPAIRSIKRRRRQCIFLNEEQLLLYKYYTKRNCESECQAAYLMSTCNCIPFYLPLIYPNATTCAIKDNFCASRAQQAYVRGISSPCMQRCQTSCFDLAFQPDAFTSPLADEGNYTIQSKLLMNMTKGDMRRNIAVLHFYYRESVLHSDLKNVYIGLTEFLSNTGGIMGLFMGFSFISIAEIVYFSFLRPIFKFALPRKFRKMGIKPNMEHEKENIHWMSQELGKPAAKAFHLDVPK